MPVGQLCALEQQPGRKVCAGDRGGSQQQKPRKPMSSSKEDVIDEKKREPRIN